ncbi:MAG: hypothetical protein MI743_12755 [Sneathiellales bacterium]|nr:hypothetical protein [Sneathiellales bacterium]
MYTDLQPSPRYQQLLGYYRLMHKNGFSRRQGERVVHVPPEEAFAGRAMTSFIYSIRGVIRATGSETILDYGSGKGLQYSEELVRKRKVIASSIHDFWKVREITCYDPAINNSFLSDRIKFDGVVSTNVIDHIPEEDLEWVLKRLFSKSRKFVFLNVANFNSPFWLPNGENARIIRKPRTWWTAKLEKINQHFPDVAHCLAYAETKKTEEGIRRQFTSYLHNCPGLILPGPKVKVKGSLKAS